MQIPRVSLPFGLGLLQPPPPGGRPQASPDPQAQVQAQTPLARALARAVEAGALGEAVEALAAEGRLPRRGSLVDLRA